MPILNLSSILRAIKEANKEPNQMGSLSKDLVGVSLKESTPKAQSITLMDGLSGNIQTVSFMKKVAKQRASHPLVREFALKIIQAYGVNNHAYKDEALAIGDFVLNRVRYVRDPRDHELLQDPVMMIEKLEKHGFTQGDCDDMALFIATLLLSTGHNPKFRCVRYHSLDGPYNHIYVVCYERNYPEPQERVVLDAILKDKPIGAEIGHASGDEFDI